MMSPEPRLTRQTLKVLGALASSNGRELSGAELAKLSKLASGTLYPLLHRLENAGWLKSRWEEGDPSILNRPRRRYYKITAQGVRSIRSVVRELSPALGVAWRK
jgi:DNA-binding PadR family transcriptional regulator